MSSIYSGWIRLNVSWDIVVAWMLNRYTFRYIRWR